MGAVTKTKQAAEFKPVHFTIECHSQREVDMLSYIAGCSVSLPKAVAARINDKHGGSTQCGFTADEAQAYFKQVLKDLRVHTHPEVSA